MICVGTSQSFIHGLQSWVAHRAEGRASKTSMIRHFNQPNIIMIELILFVDDIVHVQQVSDNLVGLIVGERLSLTEWHCAVDIIIHG